MYLEFSGLVLDRVAKVAYVSLSSRCHHQVAELWANIMNYELITFHSFYSVEEDSAGIDINSIPKYLIKKRSYTQIKSFKLEQGMQSSVVLLLEMIQSGNLYWKSFSQLDTKLLIYL